MPIIKAEKITKSFVRSEFNPSDIFRPKKTEVVAVKDLDLEIEEGELIGFLGPNGAGKTTFLKILTGIIYPTSGTAEVLGFTPWERDFRYLGQIALVMGQKNQLWWDLPAIDSFYLLKEVYSVDDIRFKKNLDLIAETLQMKDLLTKRLRNMSLGERMKCELAASFLHDPKVIFLDEPTIGLDVVSSQSIRNFLKNINKEKKCTLILTSHYMGDIEALCKRVVIINQGMKMYDGDLKQLKAKYAPERRIEIFLANLEERKLFTTIKAKKRICEGVGIIEADKATLGNVVKEIFEKFAPENVTISDADTEEVIRKIFSEKK